MLDSASDAAIGLDLTGCVVTWNRAATDLFGFERAEAVGKHLTDLTLAPANVDDESLLFDRALAGHATRPFETQRRHRNGSSVDVEISAGPMFDSNGKVSGVVKILRPIAERLALLQSLRSASEDLERQVADRTLQLERTARLAHVGGWELDPRTGAVTVTDEVLRIFGLSKDVSFDRNRVFQMFSAEARTMIDELRPNAIATGEGWDVEVPAISADGRSLWIRHLATVEHADDGGVRLVGALQDLSAFRDAGNAVKEAQSVLSDALQVVGAGLAIFDVDNQLAYFNEGYRVLMANLGEKVALGAHLEVIERESAVRNLGLEGDQLEEWVAQRVAAHQDGGEWISSVEHGSRYNVVVRRLADGRLMTFYSDVTVLEEAREIAENASRAKSEFLSNTSHEIRTPLNAILGLTYLLESSSLSTDQHAMISQISQSGRSLLGLLNDVLDLSKIEAGHLELEQQLFDLRQLIKEETNLARLSMEEKGLELWLEVDSAVPVVVKGDATRVRQVLVNLLSNAVKFTDRGEVAVRVTASGNTTVTISVSDSGVGIETSAIDRLFEPFVQADTSTTRRFGGTGLGLSIVSRIVELMGGEIVVRSTKGEGSTFAVTIPLETCPDNAALDTFENRPLRVVIAEDNDRERDLLVSLSNALGWRTLAVQTGRQLIDTVVSELQNGHPVDALVVERQMPDVSGISALAEIREALHGLVLPAVVLVRPQDQHRVRDTHPANLATSILIKKATGSALFNAVNEAIVRTNIKSNRVTDGTVMGRHNMKWLAGVQILVVDDSPLNLEVAGKVLALEGAHVFLAANGPEALAILSDFEHDFDAVLLDVQMPGMDGYETVRRIRTIDGFQEVPVIALSAGVLQSERMAAQAAGMTDFLAKPLEPQRVIGCLRRHIEHYRKSPVIATTSPAPDNATRGKLGANGRRTFELDIPGINMASVVQVVRDDPSVYLSMLQRFLDEFRDVATTEPEKTAARLHKMIGGSKVLGATLLAERATHIERAARAQHDVRSDLGVLSAIIGRIEADARGAFAAERVLVERSEELALADARNADPISAEELGNLRVALEQHDFYATELVDQLAGNLRVSLPTEQFKELVSVVNGFDFDRAIQLLSSLD